jgi:hypothetical protein
MIKGLFASFANFAQFENEDLSFVRRRIKSLSKANSLCFDLLRKHNLLDLLERIRKWRKAVPFRPKPNPIWKSRDQSSCSQYH